MVNTNSKYLFAAEANVFNIFVSYDQTVCFKNLNIICVFGSHLDVKTYGIFQFYQHIFVSDEVIYSLLHDARADGDHLRPYLPSGVQTPETTAGLGPPSQRIAGEPLTWCKPGYSIWTTGTEKITRK